MDISMLKQVSLDGFQVVNSTLFCSLNSPSMSIWVDSISFSQASYAALNNCEAISIMLNNSTKEILITTVSSNAQNAVNWKKGKEVVKYCKINCASFTKPIFEDWGYEEKAKYKAIGRLVQVNGKIGIIYDFTNAEKSYGEKAVK